MDNTRLILSPKTRVATKSAADSALEKHIAELREKAKTAMKDGKSTVVTRGPGEEIVIKRSEQPSAGGGQEVNEQVIVKVVRAGKDTGAAAVTIHKGGATGAQVVTKSRIGEMEMAHPTHLAELGRLAIYRLANLKRGEQPLMLFSVPDGYSVKDAPAVPIKSK